MVKWSKKPLTPRSVNPLKDNSIQFSFHFYLSMCRWRLTGASRNRWLIERWCWWSSSSRAVVVNMIIINFSSSLQWTMRISIRFVYNILSGRRYGGHKMIRQYSCQCPSSLTQSVCRRKNEFTHFTSSITGESVNTSENARTQRDNLSFYVIIHSRRVQPCALCVCVRTGSGRHRISWDQNGMAMNWCRRRRRRKTVCNLCRYYLVSLLATATAVSSFGNYKIRKRLATGLPAPSPSGTQKRRRRRQECHLLLVKHRKDMKSFRHKHFIRPKHWVMVYVRRNERRKILHTQPKPNQHQKWKTNQRLRRTDGRNGIVEKNV